MIPSHATEEGELRRSREDLASLETRIAEIEPRLAALRAEMRAFESRYLSVIGNRYDELAGIEKEIARLQGLDAEEEDLSVADDEVGCGQNRFHGDKLKKLYREVARRFHPDLTSCDQERLHRNQLMVEVNRAYETGAEDRLRQLLEAGAGRESIESGGAMSAERILLVRRLAETRERLAALDADLAEITSAELYKLKLRVENADAMGVDLFSDLLLQVDRQIAKAQNRLHALQGVMMTK
ncbi:MAG: J domain-containing protein [Blastocatellia bacterium]